MLKNQFFLFGLSNDFAITDILSIKYKLLPQNDIKSFRI